MLLRKIEEIAGATPAIVTGDLNCREKFCPVSPINRPVAFH